MTKLLEYSKTYKPFYYDWAVEYADSHEKMHWIHQEVDLSNDVKDWQHNLTPAEKNLFHQIMKLFTQSDAQVAQNYIDYLLPVFKNNEIRQMLVSFAAREGVHQRAYAAILETLNLPDTDFEAFLDYTEMFDKIEFWKLNDTHTLSGKALALTKNIFAEGVSLFGSFIMLLNFQRNEKMLGTNVINRWSILDENCLTGDTDVLTLHGWKNIKEITLNDFVLQYDTVTHKQTFVNPTRVIKTTTDEIITFSSKNYSQSVTPEHRMIMVDGKEELAKNDLPTDLVISGYKTGVLKTLSDKDKELISLTKQGKLELSDWVLLNEVTPEWCNSFLIEYDK